MTDLQTGDAVIVTNKDGETTDGEILQVHETAVSDFTIDFMDASNVLFDYWSETSVTESERVVTVNLSPEMPVVSQKDVYDYPESRVEVSDD